MFARDVVEPPWWPVRGLVRIALCIHMHALRSIVNMDCCLMAHVAVLYVCMGSLHCGYKGDI